MSATREGVVSFAQQTRDQIAKARTEAIKAEIKEGGGNPDELETAPIDAADPLKPADMPVEDWSAMSDEAKAQAITEAKQRAEAPETPAEEPAATVAPEVPSTTKIKIKVDGQELEVDEEQIRAAGIRTLQKETAADKRLEDATRLFKEAQEMVNRAAAGPKDTTGPSTDGPVNEDALAKAAKAIQYGSEAEAKEALAGLIEAAGAKGKPLTQTDVLELLEYSDAKKWVEGEFKDVLADPKMRKLFVDTEKEKRAAGDGRPYRELYQEIGVELRDWKKAMAPPASTTTATRADVQARKTAIVQVPTTASRQPAPQTVKEPSPSDVIDKMRQARHQRV